MTASCENCPLGVSNAVASRGPVPAQLLLLSGAPRYHEEYDGVAFASPLFPWLEGALAECGLDPANVHYATLTGCRPPRQRPLRNEEIEACAPRLDLTIAAVAPRVVVLCGPDAVATALPGTPLASAHGTLIRRNGRCYYPLRHPYTAPHSERYVAEVMDDLRRLATLLEEGLPAAEEGITAPSVTGETPAPVDEARAAEADQVAAAVGPMGASGVSSSREWGTEPAGVAPDQPASGEILSSAVVADWPDRHDERVSAAGETNAEGANAIGDIGAGAGGADAPELDSADNPTQLSLF